MPLNSVHACIHTPICLAQVLEGLESLNPLRHGPFRRLARHPATTDLAATTTPLAGGAVPPAAPFLAPVELVFPIGVIVLHKKGSGPIQKHKEYVGETVYKTEEQWIREHARFCLLFLFFAPGPSTMLPCSCSR